MILKSGRKAHFPWNILAIVGPADNVFTRQLQVVQDQDDPIEDAKAGGDPLTSSERQEIAEEMIARWRKWGGLPARSNSFDPSKLIAGREVKDATFIPLNSPDDVNHHLGIRFTDGSLFSLVTQEIFLQEADGRSFRLWGPGPRNRS